MRLDVGLPTEIVTAGSDSNVSVCIRLGVEAIQRNCYNETNNNKKEHHKLDTFTRASAATTYCPADIKRQPIAPASIDSFGR